MKHSILILLVAAGLLLGPAAPARAAGCATYHTVQVGENLFRIGLKYGLAWPVVAAANGMASPYLVWVGQQLCIPAVLPAVTVPTPAPGSGGGAGPTPTPAPVVVFPNPSVVPTFTIKAVARDGSVTINAINFPTNTTFDVLLGAYGTLGAGGTNVGTQNSGPGAFTATYNIPANLKGAQRIAIRLQSVATSYYSFNWFWNSNAP
jgi:hypothetical protein